jgi:hypothetical protein
LSGSEKSNTTQHKLTLLTNRLGFSPFGTSLNDTSGSMPATTLDGNTADDMRFTVDAGQAGPALGQLVVRCIALPLAAALRPGLEPETCSPFPEAEDFRGSLGRNCFHIVPQVLISHSNGMPTATPKLLMVLGIRHARNRVQVTSDQRQ